MSTAFEAKPTLQSEHLLNGTVGRGKATQRDQETPGVRLARLRRDKGIAQVELAEKLGITQSVVSDYERDVLRPNSDLIVQLTQILGVAADELLEL